MKHCALVVFVDFIAADAAGGGDRRVLDENGDLISTITCQTLSQIVDALGGSRGTDVTGGMASKVAHMLDLVDVHDQLQILIFSGLVPKRLQDVLLFQDTTLGTVIN